MSIMPPKSIVDPGPSMRPSSIVAAPSAIVRRRRPREKCVAPLPRSRATSTGAALAAAQRLLDAHAVDRARRQRRARLSGEREDGVRGGEAGGAQVRLDVAAPVEAAPAEIGEGRAEVGVGERNRRLRRQAARAASHRQLAFQRPLVGVGFEQGRRAGARLAHQRSGGVRRPRSRAIASARPRAASRGRGRSAAHRRRASGSNRPRASERSGGGPVSAARSS